jgi:hypothetical protein
LNERLGFDSPDEVDENVVENANLLFVELISLAKEKAGDTPEGVCPFFGGTASDRDLKLGEQRRVGHGLLKFLFWVAASRDFSYGE